MTWEPQDEAESFRHRANGRKSARNLGDRVVQKPTTGLTRHRIREFGQTAQRLVQASMETSAGLRIDEDLLAPERDPRGARGGAGVHGDVGVHGGVGWNNGIGRADGPGANGREDEHHEVSDYDSERSIQGASKQFDRRHIRVSMQIRVAAVALALLVAVLALVMWRTTPAPPTFLETPDQSTAASPATSPASSSQPTSPGPSPQTSAEVTVHVSGQVLAPGVFVLPAGARVADALAAAGGAQLGADLNAINLARTIEDGEQIYFPAPGEVIPNQPERDAGASDRSASGSGRLVNINTADVAGLDTLPGVGPVIAQRIIDWRTKHGNFSSVDDLLDVPGIGAGILAKLRDSATV